MFFNFPFFKKTSSAGKFPGPGSFSHGVHPSECKELGKDVPIEIVPTPKKIILPLLQHIGAPCTPVAKKKQTVAFGEIVAKGNGFISAPVHSPVAGVVQKTQVTTLSNGRHLQAMVIKSDDEQLSGQALWDKLYGGPWPQETLQSFTPKQISEAVSASGIVGLGGAAFPTHVKLIADEKKPVDTLIINGCECEPYLTTDYRVMVEAPGAVVAGARLAANALGVKKVYIGIEDNKPEAVEALRGPAAEANIEIAVVKTKYPQGSEKHLIKSVLNREVPVGALPSAVGVAVTNVATATSIARAVMREIPLTHRVISVTGSGIVHPKNLLAPIGITMGELIEFCGGLKKSASRIIAGGPMMGFCFTNPNTPVTKGTSGITILTDNEVRQADRTVCVRCGRCVDVCPMKLVPTKLAAASRFKDLDLAQQYNIMACFECGSCAYICPASLPLVQNIRTGKALIAAQGKK